MNGPRSSVCVQIASFRNDGLPAVRGQWGRPLLPTADRSHGISPPVRPDLWVRAVALSPRKASTQGTPSTNGAVAPRDRPHHRDSGSLGFLPTGRVGKVGYR